MQVVLAGGFTPAEAVHFAIFPVRLDAMRDFSNWSLNLGQWFGVHVRLHAFFLLFAVCCLYVSGHDVGPDSWGYSGWLILAILFLSVLAHEAGHCYAALKVGGTADQIVLGPLGGLVPPQPHEPQHELFIALAGPLVNLAIWLITLPILWWQDVNVLGLLNPLGPSELLNDSIWLITLKLTFWLNWLLVLVNLLPAFPMDGGRVLKAILWPAFGARTAVQVVARGAMITAAGMCVIAWFVREPGEPTHLVPAWVALLLFAIFLFFSAQQELARLEEHDPDDELFSYDFSQGYTSLERTFERRHRRGPGALRLWLDERRRMRQVRQQLIERDEESQVDAILARLHETGMDGLTAKERALLERVSARYRNRQRS